jgi:micrococcal nuclease
VQCFGKEASKKMHELAYKKKVRLEADPTQDEIDKYGRWLRYVYLENGTLVNQWMIEYGYGHEYTYKSNPYKFQTQFKASEDKARRLNLGLWSPSVCNN